MQLISHLLSEGESANIDITIDLETLSLTSTAAVVKMSAVAWHRWGDNHPYAVQSTDADGIADLAWWYEPFSHVIDLRSCINIGLDFDPSTIAWWQRQSQEARQSVLLDGTPRPITLVMSEFFHWLLALRCKVVESGCPTAPSFTLWAQGSDFDIAIIRNIIHRIGPEQEKAFSELIPYTSFRDARTFILELGKVLHGAFICDDPITAKRLYSVFPVDPFWNIPNTHDSLYDACRTSWQLWYLFQNIKCTPDVVMPT